MKKHRLIGLTALAMIAFAGNSLLCRLALKTTQIDAASFTSLRLISGALVLYLLVRLERPSASPKGDWRSAFMLFIYAAGFSLHTCNCPPPWGHYCCLARFRAL
jgi:drug/metabolite transporter (DMT)-like permease